ncbi:unnamed protein product [Parnassius apollo]|uniref:(apollo) hypothetical protein n=1 Tax=Parnassius apollo TaxID=110799 RepID=A0A8S3XMA1_PARAO|nr:unnamed protein product [Parnassius apollo]
MTIEKSEKANDFVAKLKADGSEKDFYDLGKVYKDYKNILTDLPAKDKGTFSLNVLCILCRNLDKVPVWRDKISNKELLELCIDCLRQTRALNKPEQVKTLACVYHIHRHIIRQNTSIPPELMLKLSYMPFEVSGDCLLKEYCKTYWSILADRFVYIEKLKSSRLAIVKLLPKLTEDIATIISLYDPVQFCANVLPFVIKKLHTLYSDNCFKEVRETYNNILGCIASKNNLKSFKNATEKETLDLYIKFNECLYVIVENDSRSHFKDSKIYCVMRTMMYMFEHNSDIFHCFQTIYLNCFCCLFDDKVNSSYMETALQSLQLSCETTEKLGYQKAMYATYPFVAQLLRLFIEYFVTNCDTKKWDDNFDVQLQEHCLKLILFLVKKLSKTQQLAKCENCTAKTGLHDALRLTFLVRHFVIISINQQLNITHILPSFYEVVKLQYIILTELNKLGCSNQMKCLKKLQTDIHNTAITLNKAQYYEFSIKLFDLYLKYEICYMENDSEFKNIARALYNKSISELDCKLYENGIRSAYLSLVFSETDGLTSEKYMSLVMDIKAKALKKCEEESGTEGNQEDLQTMTVLRACQSLEENNDYGNLKPFLSTLKFSTLLKHEFSMYVKLWPSIVPIAGVWTSLKQLLNREHSSWLTVESEETLLWTLYEVMLETPTAVRTIHSEHYKTVVAEELERFNKKPAEKFEERAVHATLLFLQSEYDIAEATEKYGWKATEPILDPDQAQVLRTLPQEHQALRCAVQAVHIWTEILPRLNAAPVTPLLHHCLQIAEVFVQQFLHTYRHVYGLQLAHVCCELARHIDAKEAYIRNAGVILLQASRPSDRINHIIALATTYWTELVMSRESLEAALVFACELAMYYDKWGSTTTAAKLVQFAQARLLDAWDKHPNLNMDFALGRLVEAQSQLCRDCGPSTMSSVNAIQRHFVTVTNPESRWCKRRYRGVALKRSVCGGGVLAAGLARALRLWRRARSAAAAALPACSAPLAASLHAALTDGNHEDAQIKIDNRIKHILGLQPTNEIQPYCQHANSKIEPFTPKYTPLETMLENGEFKKVQTSPSLPCITIPTFKMSEFLTHDRKCTCYACEAPYSLILAFQTCTLEASMYYRSKEFEIARSYFAGASEALRLCEAKLNDSFRNASKKFQKYILDIVKDMYNSEIRNIEVEMLIEASFFELAQENYDLVNDKVVRIHEIMQETKLNPYLANDVNNLLIATARLRRVFKKHEEIGLEVEMENLKLSPNSELIKTPETKYVPEKNTNKVVKDEEVPILKRKVIKLNLDDESPDEKELGQEVKKQEFKIPVPITAKPVLETITPRPSRTRPKVLISQATVDCEVTTPSSNVNEKFFTPCASTPGEQFFTPMTSFKTYSRKRSGIVKNLENEFSTPKAAGEKENMVKPPEQPKTRAKVKVDSGTVKNLRDKRSLKRATSPGKLSNETTVRSRVRQPVGLKD